MECGAANKRVILHANNVRSRTYPGARLTNNSDLFSNTSSYLACGVSRRCRSRDRRPSNLRRTRLVFQNKDARDSPGQKQSARLRYSLVRMMSKGGCYRQMFQGWSAFAWQAMISGEELSVYCNSYLSQNAKHSDQ